MLRAACAAAPAIAPRLGEPTADVDPDVRLGALSALAALPVTPDVIADRARHLLRDPAARVRVGAVGVLKGLGSDVPAVTPALAGALRHGDPDVRCAAAVALGAVRTDDDTVVTHALTGFHRRGGQDPPPPEPSREARCRNAPPGSTGC